MKIAPRVANHEFNALAVMDCVVVTAVFEDGRITLGNGSGRIIRSDGGSVYAQSEVSKEKDADGRVPGVIHDGVWRPPVSICLMGRADSAEMEADRFDVKAGTPVILHSSFVNEPVAVSSGTLILVLDAPAELAATLSGPCFLARDLVFQSR